MRITFNSQDVDLHLAYQGLVPGHIQNKKQSRSGSGLIETINIYGIQEITARCYIEPDKYRQMVAWWAWARQGKTWAFAEDSGKTTNTTLDDAAAAGQKVIPLTATAGLSVDDECLIRAEDNDDEFEIIKVESISAGVSVTAAENLIYSYAAADLFRHKNYWPSVVSLDKAFKPQPMHRGWHSISIKFVEAL